MKVTIDEILSSKKKVQFKNGKFRVLCISDMHGGVGYDEKSTVADIKAMVDGLKPQLVVLGGDNAGPGSIHVSNKEELKKLLDGLVSPMEEAGIPWCHVFGNHDDNYGLVNAEAEKVYEEYNYCVSKSGPECIGATGNYVVPIYDSKGEKVVFSVWGIDSHAGFDDLPNLKNPILPIRMKGSGERGVDTKQVVWYWQASETLEEYVGNIVPGLMCMHVPLPELSMIYDNKEYCGVEGIRDEEVSCTPLNSGLFRACAERGDIKAINFGHDHVNNIAGKYMGIILAADGYLSYHACHDRRLRGGRIYDICENDTSEITTEFKRADEFRPNDPANIKEVYEFLKKAGTYFISTVDYNSAGVAEPKVRPFGTVDLFEGKIYIQTGIHKPVASQLLDNEVFQISAFHEGKTMRVTGKAVYDERIEPQEHLLNNYPELSGMYKAGDGNNAVFYLDDAKAEISSFTEPTRIIFF